MSNEISVKMKKVKNMCSVTWYNIFKGEPIWISSEALHRSGHNQDHIGIEDLFVSGLLKDMKDFVLGAWYLGLCEVQLQAWPGLQRKRQHQVRSSKAFRTETGSRG